MRAVEQRDVSRSCPPGRRRFAHAASVSTPVGDVQRSAVPTATLRRQFARSRSVPGRLVAAVSRARSSAWTRKSAERAALAKPWIAAITSTSGARSESSRGSDADAGAPNGVREQGLVVAPRLQRGAFVLGVAEAERVSLRDVRAGPPAGDRRQVVSRYARGRLRRIAGGIGEAGVVALEPDDTVRQHVRLGEPSRKPSGTVPRSSPTTRQRAATLSWRARPAAARRGNGRTRRRAPTRRRESRTAA